MTVGDILLIIYLLNEKFIYIFWFEILGDVLRFSF
jgi:hypothetical protein